MEDFARILFQRLPPPVGADRASLIGEFKRLQTVRIRAYQHFDASLFELVRENRLASYSDLCSHYTSVFSDISAAVRQLRDRLQLQDAASARLISNIQEAEKTKLGLVAKYHMAYMSSHSPLNFAGHTEATEDEYASKIRKLEELVSEEMDNLQSMLCEDVDLAGATIR